LITPGNDWYVYKHTSPSGKVYIGITKDIQHRWRGEGRGYNGCSRFYRAIQKYGWDNIRHEVLYEKLSHENACRKEVELISQYHSTDERFGYNLLSGGQSALHSEESKEKIRRKNMGHTLCASARAKISRARSIPIVCLETKEVFPNAKAAAAKLNLCETSIGKVCNGRASNVGGYHFAKKTDFDSGSIPSFIHGKSPCKEVICLTTGEVFQSEKEAARKYSITSQAISRACRGVVKTCHGMEWKLKEDNK